MTDENLRGEVPAEAAIPVPEKDDDQAETAAAPESEGAEKPEVKDESEDKPKKPSGGFQRRIDELTRNWRDEQRRNDELMTLLKQGAPQPAQQPATAPTLEQHGYDEGKYQAALTDYVRNLTQAETRTAFEAERVRVQQVERTKSFKTRELEFAATVEDYADKVYDPSLPLTREVVELIADSDIGPRVAYYLADHPDIARSLADMTPVQAAREFGKIEAKLSTSAPRKSVSTAPPPPPKLASVDSNTLAASADDPESDNLSMDQWLKLREKQLRKKR